MMELKKKSNLVQIATRYRSDFRDMGFISDSTGGLLSTGGIHFVLFNQVTYIKVLTFLCYCSLDESRTLSLCTPHKGRDLGTVVEQIMFMKG